MAVRLEQAGEGIHAIATGIIERHHKHLQFAPDSWVRLCILMAYQDDPECPDPPVKCDGYPSAAVISVIPYKQRVDKRADAEILIDGKHWEGLPERQQMSLLDHEITHLELTVDKNGCIKTDDEGRPKLKLKLHDYQIGGFRSIARRYREDALEVQHARQFEKDFGQDVLAAEKMFA